MQPAGTGTKRFALSLACLDISVARFDLPSQRELGLDILDGAISARRHDQLPHAAR
jgi:hypothetical protein